MATKFAKTVTAQYIAPEKPVNLLDTAPLATLNERHLIPAQGDLCYLEAKCACQYSSNVLGVEVKDGQIYVTVFQLRIHEERRCWHRYDEGERGYKTVLRDHKRAASLLDDLCTNRGVLTIQFETASWHRRVIATGPNAGKICWRVS